ncbi:hypothetical protein [Infirmifilum sp. SLHALR2]
MSGEGEGSGAEELWFMERRHVLILLYLYRVGYAIKSEFIPLLRSRNTYYIERALMDLEEHGLVEERLVGKKSRIFGLTEKGRRVAEVLDKLARMIAEEEGRGEATP